MSNINSNHQRYGFAKRLKAALLQAGLVSNASVIGVQATPLARCLGVSVQTVRKYLQGKTLPEFDKIDTMARFLRVSSAWLLFGEEQTQHKKRHLHSEVINQFEIKKIFLRAILHRLFDNVLNFAVERDLLDSISEFLYGLINDIAQLEAPDDEKLRLIDASVISASILGKFKWKKHVVMS